MKLSNKFRHTYSLSLQSKPPTNVNQYFANHNRAISSHYHQFNKVPCRDIVANLILQKRSFLIPHNCRILLGTILWFKMQHLQDTEQPSDKNQSNIEKTHCRPEVGRSEFAFNSNTINASSQMRSAQVGVRQQIILISCHSITFAKFNIRTTYR